MSNEAVHRIEPKSEFWEGLSLKQTALDSAIRAGTAPGDLIDQARKIEAYLREKEGAGK